jgi:hypothetical protein
MRYRKIGWILTLFSLCLSGCSIKGEKQLLKVYEQEKGYHRHLLHTEKAQLYEGNETKVLLTATYLSPQRGVSGDEAFIVGLYVEDETIQTLQADDFSLRLNGMPPKRIVALKRGSAELGEIPFMTEWGDYFKVVFPHSERSRFELIFESQRDGRAVLPFAKKAKYLFTKEVF